MSLSTQCYIPSFKATGPLVLEKKSFEGFLPYMGTEAILVKWKNFCSPVPWRLHMKFGFNLPSGFRGEDIWKCWQTTDNRQTDNRSSPILQAHHWTKGSGELKCTFGYVHPVKIWISLHICAGWSESSLGKFWIAKDSKFLHVDNKD